MKFVAVLCVAYFGLLTFPAKAATLTCTFQFTASGTIGSQSFTNARITLTTVGDTANRQGVVGLNAQYSIVNDSVTVSISSLGTFQLTSPALYSILVSNGDFSDNLPPGGVQNGDLFISFGSTYNSTMIITISWPITLPWDMSSSLGLFNPTQLGLSGWKTPAVNTSGGILNIFDIPRATGGGTFQATITPTVAVTPTQFNLAYQIGSVLPVGVLQVSGLGSPGAFTVSASASGNWLSANPTSGMTPVTGTSPVTVNISPSGLNAGTYSGTVSVTQNGATVIVPVNLTVGAAPIPNPNDVNGDGVVNVVDIQMVINAALGAAGSSGQEN